MTIFPTNELCISLIYFAFLSAQMSAPIPRPLSSTQICLFAPKIFSNVLHRKRPSILLPSHNVFHHRPTFRSLSTNSDPNSTSQNRSVHIKVHPRPTSIAQTRQILRAMQEIGEVAVFKWLKASQLFYCASEEDAEIYTKTVRTPNSSTEHSSRGIYPAGRREASSRQSNNKAKLRRALRTRR